MPRTKFHSPKPPEDDGDLFGDCPQIDPKEACGNYPKTKLNQEAMKLHVNGKLEKKLAASNERLAVDGIQIALKLIGDRVYLWHGDKEALKRNFPLTSDGLADAEVVARNLVKLEQINQRLADQGTRVSLKLAGGGKYLYLRATLTLKPGASSKNGKRVEQYDLSVNGRGLPFTDDGLKLAEEEAGKLGLLILHDVFVWNEKYLSGGSSRKSEIEGEEEQVQPTLIGELLVDFEKLYFGKRKRNRQSESTFSNYMAYLPKLPQDVPLTEKLILDTILATEAGSGKRLNLVRSLSVFCNTIKFSFDFKGYRDGYKPKERVLPADNEIEKTFFNSFKPAKKCRKKYRESYLAYQWIYGMLAAYGLRPHELFAVDFEQSFKDEENSIFLNEIITDGIKTGERWVFPLRPDWVELFDLKNPKQLVGTAKLKTKVNMVSNYFRDHGISFPPYNLRHALAVRGHRLEVPIKEMADNMGHSVDQHTNTYQRWMSLNDRKEVYNKAMNRGKEVEREKTELELLRERVAQLEEEVKRLEGKNQELMGENKRLHQDLIDFAAKLV